MTVRMEQGVILFEGHCLAGEAEDLLQILLSSPAASVDWRACESAHTALVQVLLAAGRDIVGPPRGTALASIAAALTRGP